MFVALIGILLPFQIRSECGAANLEVAGREATSQPALDGAPVRPEDLRAEEAEDYQLVPGDVVELTLTELAQGTLVNLSLQVDPMGDVTLPALRTRKLHVASMTANLVRTAMDKAYREAKSAAQVESLVVTEAHGRTFTIFGQELQPGVYSFFDRDMRLLDALATARATQLSARIARVLRRPTRVGDVARVVDVSLERLVEGDANTNIVIRPGDVVIVTRSNATSAKAMVPAEPAGGRAVLPIDLEAAKPSEYLIAKHDQLKITLINLVPGNESETTVIVSDSGNVTLPHLPPLRLIGLTVPDACDKISDAYGATGLPSPPLVVMTVVQSPTHSFCLVGDIRQPGVYPVQGNDFRLLDALALGSGPLAGSAVARVIRGNTDAARPATTIDISVKKLLAGEGATNVVVRPGDTIVLMADGERRQ